MQPSQLPWRFWESRSERLHASEHAVGHLRPRYRIAPELLERDFLTGSMALAELSECSTYVATIPVTAQGEIQESIQIMTWIKDHPVKRPQAPRMTTQIHGHEVMQMMLELNRAFTRDSLRQAIQERFGEDARFFTCSAQSMTADELIEFLAARGKFVGRDAGFSTAPEHICQH